MAITLNLKQITELAGHDARRMKQMADEDIFQPIEKPRAQRVARLYSLSEAAIALIVARLDRYGIKPGSLFNVAAFLRDVMMAPAYFGFNTVEEAIRRRWNDYIFGVAKTEGTDKAKKVASDLGIDAIPSREIGLALADLHHIDNWLSIREALDGKETKLSLAVKDNGDWTLWFGNPVSDEVDNYIVLRLDRILSVLRT